MAQRTRVGIVFGGASSEHDVSCMTAGGVSRAIDADRFDVIGIGITPSGRWVQVPADELRGLRKQGDELPRLSESRATAVLLPGSGGGARVATVDGDRRSSRAICLHDLRLSRPLSIAARWARPAPPGTPSGTTGRIMSAGCTS